jgi:hypothetical protein
MEPISFLPHYIEFGHIQLSQTLITSLFSTALFIVFVLLYRLFKKLNPHNYFVSMTETMIEQMTDFFAGVSGGLSYQTV